MFLKNIFFMAILICGIAGIAEANQTIIINSIGDHPAGEKFNISGSTSLEDCKKIGIEIFPAKYWDEISEFAKGDKSGKVKFRQIPKSQDSANPSGINLIRYNVDETQTYQPFNVSENYAAIVVPVTKDSKGNLQWVAEINEKVKEIPFAKGKYHINVYDATKEKEREGTVLQNGWDIINQKIYPSTTLPNIWDSKNEKDMIYAEFSIR